MTQHVKPYRVGVVLPLRDARMLRLVRSFHTLERYPYAAFEPLQFQRWCRRTQGAGGMHACRFILSVWNSTTRWRSGRFVVADALATWDPGMREAFVAWARKPWWP